MSEIYLILFLRIGMIVTLGVFIFNLLKTTKDKSERR